MPCLPRALGGAESLAFSPDGRLLAVGGAALADAPLVKQVPEVDRGGRRAKAGPGRLLLWEVKTGALQRDLEGHVNQVGAVAFSPDGKLLASVGSWLEGMTPARGVLIWDLASGAQKSSIRTLDNGGPRSVTFSPDGKSVVMGTQHFMGPNKDQSSAGISLVNVATGNPKWDLTVAGYGARSVTFSPDGKSVVVLSGNAGVVVLDAKTGKLQLELLPEKSPIPERWNDIAVSPRADVLAIGGVDGQSAGFVEVRDFGSLRLAAEVKVLQGEWVAVRAEADGRAKTPAQLKDGDVHLTVTGDAFSLKEDPRAPLFTPRQDRKEKLVTFDGRFDLDVTRTPKACVWSGKVAGTAFELHGVYEVSGDTLLLCYGLAGPNAKRPTEFKTAEKSGHVLVEFKRHTGE